MEGLGQIRDRSVGPSELLQDAASGGVRERGERGIEPAAHILNHAVQYAPTNPRPQGPVPDDDTPARTRGNFLFRLAEALAVAGSLTAARERYGEAEQVFVTIGHVERQIRVVKCA